MGLPSNDLREFAREHLAQVPAQIADSVAYVALSSLRCGVIGAPCCSSRDESDDHRSGVASMAPQRDGRGDGPWAPLWECLLGRTVLAPMAWECQLKVVVIRISSKLMRLARVVDSGGSMPRKGAP